MPLLRAQQPLEYGTQEISRVGGEVDVLHPLDKTGPGRHSAIGLASNLGQQPRVKHGLVVTGDPACLGEAFAEPQTHALARGGGAELERRELGKDAPHRGVEEDLIHQDVTGNLGGLQE